MTSSTDLISGGFYVGRIFARPEGLGRSLLPERLVTLSSCLTELLPGLLALEWVSGTQDERLAAAEGFGIAQARLPELMRFASNAFASGDLGWPSVWRSRQVARLAKATWVPADDFVILELGVPRGFAARLIPEIVPSPEDRESALHSHLKSGRLVDAAGATIGWEPLGVEGCGSFHSWLCNSLHDDLFQRKGIRPGALGLLSSATEAQAVLDLIEDGVGAEPVPWFFGAIRRLD